MSESRVAMGCGIGAVLAVAPCPASMSGMDMSRQPASLPA